MIILTKDDFLKTYIIKKFGKRFLDSHLIQFPLKGNINLSRIVSYLTFDGHLAERLSMFLFTAGKKEDLHECKNLVKNEFGLDGKFKKIDTNMYGTSYEYRIISKPISRILELIGVPKGNKVIKKFRVPLWIKNNKKLSISYLKVAFHCEGSMWKEPGRIRIRFKIGKDEKIVNNGILFMDDIRFMLKKLNILTTKIWTINGNTRKNGGFTLYISFDIKAQDVNKFMEVIGFSKY